MPEFTLENVLEDLSLLLELNPLQIYQEELIKYFNIYKLTGGFLKVINEFLSCDKLDQYLYETYLQWIRGDINKLKRSEKIAKEILAELILRMVSLIEWQSIARKTSIETHKTVSDYVSLLEDFFILKIVYQLDIHKKRPRTKKMKKVYFLDNFILWALWGWCEKVLDSYSFAQSKKEEIESKLVEMFVAATLFRLDKRDWLSSRTFFWTGRKEIDFITTNSKGELVPIEVKYQNTINPKDFATQVKIGFKQGIIVSKDTLENYDKKYHVIPYYLWGLLKND